METYQKADFLKAGVMPAFIQDNQSTSRQGALRGMHFQSPYPQGKLIRTVTGEIFDVVIDIRKNSETFGKWYGIILSARNKKMLWIPEGFVHGFYVLSNYARVSYKTTDYYYPQCQHTLAWDDPTINITWPLVDGKKPLLSPRDNSGLNWQQVLALL